MKQKTFSGENIDTLRFAVLVWCRIENYNIEMIASKGLEKTE